VKGDGKMKVKELIAELEKIPNKEAEVNIHHWVLAKKSDKVILNSSKTTGVLVPLDGSFESVTIETEKIEEDI
jgi:hypothetical protein